MPIIDGKRVKARYTSLKLDELSGVDRPAQEGALALIMKRHNKEEDTMTKTVEQLEAQVAELTKACEDKDTEMEALREEAETAKRALAEATDATMEFGGQTFKRSEVGDATFNAMKAMRDERDTATFEKSAAEKYPNLVGTAAEKALILKAREGMDDATKAALDAVLNAAEKMTSAGFQRLGTDYAGVPTQTEKAAQSTFDGRVSEIAKRDNIGRSAAMQKARHEFPDEFAAAYPQQAAN